MCGEHFRRLRCDCKLIYILTEWLGTWRFFHFIELPYLIDQKIRELSVIFRKLRATNNYSKLSSFT